MPIVGMPTHSKFRLSVAVAATAIAEGFGTAGLWQRNHILSQPFFGGTTWWESTARFHVWPWTYKFAAIWALPGFMGTSILMAPIRLLLPKLPEAADLVPAAGLVALLWYWVASRLESCSSVVRWASVSVLLAASVVGASLPLGYTEWLPYGATMWCIAILLLLRRSGSRLTQATVSRVSD